MQVALTDPQSDFVWSASKYPAIVGGLGSGKTQGGTTRADMLLLREPGVNIAYYMPTYDLLRLRAMPGIEEQLDSFKIRHKVNKSEYRITVAGYGEIIFRSYDNPARIIAYEVAHSIVDELDTLPKDKAAYVWRKIDERNRQKTNLPAGNTIGNVTTPDQGYSGFTYAKWVKNPLKGSELIKAPTSSNPYLPEGYIEQIRQNYDPILADMYLNGEFVSLTQNKVYHFFDRRTHHTDRKLLPEDKFIHVSIDFNIGGCCAVVWVIEGNKPIAVKEFVSHDTRDFILKLKQFDGRKVTIYPDASGNAESTNATSSDITLIRQAGYYVDCPSRNPFIRDRINSVNGLLSHERMEVNTDECPQLTDALESQGYDTKGKPEKLDDHPSIDDWNDSMGYFINRKFPIAAPLTRISIAGN